MGLILTWISIITIQLHVFLYQAEAVKEEEHSIRCFDCSFDMRNKNCDDRFNTIGINIKNCTGSCTKVKMYNNGEDKVFGRYCSPKKETEQCRVTDAGGGQRMEDCYCNTDLCNGAIHIQLNGFLVSLILFLFHYSL